MKYTRQFRVLALSATPGSDIKVRFSFNMEWADSQIVGLGEGGISISDSQNVNQKREVPKNVVLKDI